MSIKSWLNVISKYVLICYSKFFHMLFQIFWFIQFIWRFIHKYSSIIDNYLCRIHHNLYFSDLCLNSNIKQSFNKTIIYFYGKSIQMEIINNIILETRAYSWGTRQIISYNRKFIRDFPMHSSAIYHLVSQQVFGCWQAPWPTLLRK